MTDTENNILTGCDYSALGSSAIAGKDVIALVTNKAGTKLLAIAGQQSLDFNMSQETSETVTKDSDGGGWSFKTHGSKSWDASIDGLYSPDDEAQALIAACMENSEYVCLKVCKRTIDSTGNTITYQPWRMGLAIATSDNFSAPNDDNTTYSMEFEGTGKPWIYETATDAERKAAAFTVTTN